MSNTGFKLAEKMSKEAPTKAGLTAGSKVYTFALAFVAFLFTPVPFFLLWSVAPLPSFYFLFVEQKGLTSPIIILQLAIYATLFLALSVLLARVSAHIPQKAIRLTIRTVLLGIPLLFGGGSSWALMSERNREAEDTMRRDADSSEINRLDSHVANSIQDHNYAEAEAASRKLLALRETYKGYVWGTGPDIAQTRANLSVSLSGQGNYSLAEVEAREALIVLESYAQKHPGGRTNITRMHVLMSLTEALWGQGKYTEAESAARETLATMEAHWGQLGRGLLVALARNNLAKCLRDQGKFSEAEAEFKRASAGAQEHEIMIEFAELYLRQEKHAEALPLAEKALRHQSQRYQQKPRFPPPRDKAKVYKMLERIHDGLGNAEQAQEFAAKAKSTAHPASSQTND